MTTLSHPEKSLMCPPENCNTGHLLSNVNLHAWESLRATGICSKSIIICLHPALISSFIRSTEQIHALRWEWYQANFWQKVKKTPTNPRGRHTSDVQLPSARSRRRHWATVLREAKQWWSKDMIQEQVRLLAAYHCVGSMQVPCWVKEVYTYMERCAWQKIMLILVLTWFMTRMYQCSGYWVPERGIFWEIDSATEDSSGKDESTIVATLMSWRMSRIVSLWSAEYISPPSTSLCFNIHCRVWHIFISCTVSKKTVPQKVKFHLSAKFLLR